MPAGLAGWSVGLVWSVLLPYLTLPYLTSPVTWRYDQWTCRPPSPGWIPDERMALAPGSFQVSSAKPPRVPLSSLDAQRTGPLQEAAAAATRGAEWICRAPRRCTPGLFILLTCILAWISEF
jgi:hypothetical protein